MASVAPPTPTSGDPGPSSHCALPARDPRPNAPLQPDFRVPTAGSLPVWDPHCAPLVRTAPTPAARDRRPRLSFVGCRPELDASGPLGLCWPSLASSEPPPRGARRTGGGFPRVLGPGFPSSPQPPGLPRASSSCTLDSTSLSCATPRSLDHLCFVQLEPPEPLLSFVFVCFPPKCDSFFKKDSDAFILEEILYFHHSWKSSVTCHKELN